MNAENDKTRGGSAEAAEERATDAASAVEQPTAEQPTLEQPTVEQPTVEQSTVEQPTVEQPTVEQPASRGATAPTAPLPPAEPWLTPGSGSRSAPVPPVSGGWAATASAARPPVRWGGVVWGALLVLFAVGTLFVLSAPSRLATVELWLASLTPGATWALWIALVGLLIVVFALLGAIRSAQRRRPGPTG